jgi:hypothetical protein
VGVALPGAVLQGLRAARLHELAHELADGVERQGGQVGHAAGQAHDLRAGGHGEQGADLDAVIPWVRCA